MTTINTGPMALRATFLALAILAAALLGWGAVAYAQADRPDRPTGVTASVDTDTGHVVISWDAPGSTIAKHRVFRRNRTAGDSGLTKIGNAVRDPDTSAFPDPTPTHRSEPENRYTYRVQAVDTGGSRSRKSAAVTITTPAQADESAAEETTTPLQPQDLTATTNSSYSVTLSWTNPAEHEVVKYQVWRLAAGDEHFVKVVEENQAATSHVDTGLGQGTSYSYQVFIGVTGNWGLPALVQVSTPAGTPQPTATPDPALQPHRAQNLTATRPGRRDTHLGEPGGPRHREAQDIPEDPRGPALHEHTHGGDRRHVPRRHRAGGRHDLPVPSHGGKARRLGTSGEGGDDDPGVSRIAPRRPTAPTTPEPPRERRRTVRWSRPSCGKPGR